MSAEQGAATASSSSGSSHRARSRKAMAAMVSLSHARAVGWEDTSAWRGDLAGFRQELYRSFTARADVLFELTDAVLCADGPVRSLVELTLLAEHRRGHGAMYDALNQGRVGPQRIRRGLAGGA